jgi:hypothetical protein
MPFTPDDGPERKTRADELVRKLRKQADASREERRVIAESLSKSAARRQADGESADSRATQRQAETLARTLRRKTRQ